MKFAGDSANFRGRSLSPNTPQEDSERMRNFTQARGALAYKQFPGSIRDINALKNTESKF